MKYSSFFFLLLIIATCLSESCRTLPQAYQRSGLITENAMIVSAHPLATAVGAEVLKHGGNAVDAMVAIHFALAVVLPAAGNIGGGGFMVMRDEYGRGYALDFREMAPAAAHRDMYLDKQGAVIKDLSFLGHLAVGTPGSVAGMAAAHDSLGDLPWAMLLQPAIDLAQKGFPLTPKEAALLNEKLPQLRTYSTRPSSYTAREPWSARDSIRHPELARVLGAIRDRGAAGFYQGWVADSLVAEMQRGKGIITHEDLRRYRAVWRAPLRSRYKNYRILSMPPPSSGGIALSQLLKMVEPYPLHKWGWHRPRTAHLITGSRAQGLCRPGHPSWR